MVKNIIIAVLAVCTLWLSATVVRLENYHYASFVGMCGQYNPGNPLDTVKRHQCLHETSTRTSPLWHLFYALTGD